MKHVSKFIGWLVIGVIVSVIGVVVVAMNFPGTDEFGNATGNSGGMALGALILAIGQMMFLTCTIALGVFLGVREANYERARV